MLSTAAVAMSGSSEDARDISNSRVQLVQLSGSHHFCLSGLGAEKDGASMKPTQAID